jgi:hypothetical protein
MSDDAKPAPAPAAPPPAAPAPAPPPSSAASPVAPLMWMRGGTTTTAYDTEQAKLKAQAEASRKIEDGKRLAAETNPGEARQHKRVIGGNKKFPGIVLEVRHPKDNVVLDYIECELTAEEDGTLTLIMACHKCSLRGIYDNFKFNQKHRKFELDTRKQGTLWVNPKNPRHVVTLAGTIQLTEPVICPNLGCGMRFVIDNSVLREK